MSILKFKIKKGDQVIVTTGRDKGRKGIVQKVLRDQNALLVQGVNLVKKHVKPSQSNPGEIVTKESKIHISNVAIVDPKLNVPTKVGFSILADGTKVRIAKKSGMTI